MLKNINSNIGPDINLLISLYFDSINDNDEYTTLEKLRWLYIKFGNLFSYDLRVLKNKEELAKTRLTFETSEIDRYQTCVQIADIMNVIYDNVKGCHSEVITRDNINDQGDGIKHVANAVELDTGEKIILDLTLDLYLIQSGCQTKEFGFTTDATNQYDIITLRECREMDEKLYLIPDNGYTDEKIFHAKNILNSMITKDMDSLYLFKLYIKVVQKLNKSFVGPHESKMFISELIGELLIRQKNFKCSCKEFNLAYNGDDECYKFVVDENTMWYTYSGSSGLMECSANFIISMLKGAWTTNSKSLIDELELSMENEKHDKSL